MNAYDPASAPSAATSPELAPRLIKGIHADYEPAQWPGENTSGLVPYGPNVLIKMDACAGATAGGIMLADDMIERMNLASESGCIFAIGVTAFGGYGEAKPKVGERVYVQKYAGVTARGADGGFYRVMDDTNVAAGLLNPDQAAQPSRVGM